MFLARLPGSVSRSPAPAGESSASGEGGPPGLPLPALIRLGMPGGAVLVALADPRTAAWAVLLAGIGLLEVAWTGRRPVLPQAALYRDVGYAAALLVGYLHNFAVPALLLFAVVAIESALVPRPWPWRRVAAAGLAALALRLGVAAASGHLFAHPAWLAGVGLALAGTWIWGATIRTQAALQQHFRQRQQAVRAAWETVVGQLLAESGLPAATVDAYPRLGAGLAEVCAGRADPGRCRELGQLLAGLVRAGTATSCPLTPRELEVLQWLATGLSYRAIARRLHLSPGTVRAHAGKIMRKAGTHSRSETVEWARNCRLLPR